MMSVLQCISLSSSSPAPPPWPTPCAPCSPPGKHAGQMGRCGQCCDAQHAAPGQKAPERSGMVGPQQQRAGQAAHLGLAQPGPLPARPLLRQGVRPAAEGTGCGGRFACTLAHLAHTYRLQQHPVKAPDAGCDLPGSPRQRLHRHHNTPTPKITPTPAQQVGAHHPGVCAIWRQSLLREQAQLLQWGGEGRRRASGPERGGNRRAGMH